MDCIFIWYICGYFLWILKWINNNQGKTLGIFNNNPFIPPPNFSEPDNNANINQNVVIIINAVLDVYRKYLAILVLFFTFDCK